jgi:hypothetical protein
MKTITLVTALALGTAGWAAENRPSPPPTPKPSPGPNGTSWERASAPALSAQGVARPVTAKVSPAAEVRGEVEGGGLRGTKAVALNEDEATVLIGGSARILHPGSLVGSDVVKSIGGDRIVLVRGASATNPAGSATVVVSFDAQGRSRVRVYWLSDPAANVPPEVR